MQEIVHAFSAGTDLGDRCSSSFESTQLTQGMDIIICTIILADGRFILADDLLPPCPRTIIVHPPVLLEVHKDWDLVGLSAITPKLITDKN